MRFLRGFALFALAFLFVLGLAFAVDAGEPHSTPDVTIISSDTASLPEGGTLVFLHTVGKSTTWWKVTYDGQSVSFQQEGFWIFGGTHDTVPVTPGQTVSQYMGWGQGTFWLTPERGGWVRVYWPFGWDYRS